MLRLKSSDRSRSPDAAHIVCGLQGIILYVRHIAHYYAVRKDDPK